MGFFFVLSRKEHSEYLDSSDGRGIINIAEKLTVHSNISTDATKNICPIQVIMCQRRYISSSCTQYHFLCMDQAHLVRVRK